MPPTRQIYIPNLKQITPANPEIWVSKVSKNSFVFSYSFCTLRIFDHNLQTHTPIKLLLGTRKGLIKVHLHTNFYWNPIKIYGVMIDFLRKKSLSRLQGKPLGGIGWNLACRWSNHHWSAFLGFERNREKDHGDMTQNPTGVKITRSNLWIKIPPSYTATV